LQPQKGKFSPLKNFDFVFRFRVIRIEANCNGEK
jgi:hypothetical protein